MPPMAMTSSPYVTRPEGIEAKAGFDPIEDGAEDQVVRLGVRPCVFNRMHGAAYQEVSFAVLRIRPRYVPRPPQFATRATGGRPPSRWTPSHPHAWPRPRANR